MEVEARDAGLDAREVPALSTLSNFTPETAAALAGPPWLQKRRTAAAEAFSSAPLPTEKDEVWRYSRIDNVDLDRFRPAGAGAATLSDDPGRSTSDRIHSLISSLGPRSGLMVTINGVLATVASSLDDGLLAMGRVTEPRRRAGPARIGRSGPPRLRA